MVRTLELTEDPYRLFALLSSQAFQLTAVALSGPEDAVARDFGVHPYAVSQLSKVAKKYGRSGTKKIIRIFARADDDMKLSRADPWLLIERALIQVSTV
jgi:DNA polymerase III delta subunit